MLRTALAALVAAFFALPVYGQTANVVASGQFTPGHTVRCENTTCTVQRDSGGAGGTTSQQRNFLTELGITNTGTPLCINDRFIDDPNGFHRLCLGANSLGGGLLSYDSINTITQAPFQFCVNGNCTTIPVTPAAGPNTAFHIVGSPSATWTSNPTSTTAWQYTLPNGQSFTNCASTNSQCLVEILAYAKTQGLSLDVYCPGENRLGAGGTSSTFPFLASTVPIDFGSLVQRYIHFHGCNLTVGGVSGWATKINTVLDGGYFQFDGQIVSTWGDSAHPPTAATFAVLIRPDECPPTEGCNATVTQNSFIKIGAAVTGVNASGVTPLGAVVGVDSSAGNVLFNDIWIGEINGCGPCAGPTAFYGFQAFGATGTSGFLRNKLQIGFIHNIVRGVDLGSVNNTNLATPLAYNDNEILLQSVSPFSASGECYRDSGNYNRVTILSCNNDNIFPGTYADAVTLTATSHFAHVDVKAVGYSHSINTIAGVTPLPIMDFGLGNTIIQDSQILKQQLGLSRGNQQAVGATVSYLPLAAIDAGPGGSAISMPTSSVGQISVGGSGAQTTIQITFSEAFLRAAACMGTSNQAILFETNSSQTSATFTAQSPMPFGTVFSYSCWGLP